MNMYNGENFEHSQWSYAKILGGGKIVWILVGMLTVFRWDWQQSEKV